VGEVEKGRGKGGKEIEGTRPSRVTRKQDKSPSVIT
jgi:hypothetical protein